MKRFTVPCDFAGSKMPFHVYIGEASGEWHPLYFQSLWLNEQRGGSVPADVMGSFERLRDIALENEVSFEDLCVYALGAAQEDGKKLSEGELSAEEKEKIAAAAEKPELNQIHVLASADALRSVLDEDFNLLLINSKDSYTDPIWSIVLCRAEYLPGLRSWILENNLTVEQLVHLSQLEYTGNGLEPPEAVLEALKAKYQLA